MSSQDIIKTVDTIKNIIINIERQGIVDPAKKEGYFWNNHSDLTNKYPFLISQLCSNTDNTMLNNMIQYLKQIENGEMTKAEADKSIGDQLSKKYPSK
jgi:hypothetical protein